LPCPNLGSYGAVELSRTEFDLLAALAAQPRVTLRRKLGDAGYVRTVRGFGYRMGES
jgi:DNA-binding response OmpR family regulator